MRTGAGRLLCLASLARYALPEASPAPAASYLGVNLTAPGVGCAEALPGGRVDFRSTAYQLCIRDYEVCLGVYSPDCDRGPFTLCRRVTGGNGSSSLAEAPHAQGCVAQMNVAAAAEGTPPAPAPPAVGPGAAMIVPASTISFDTVNTQNCDNVTCTLEGQSEAATCRQHMVNLMKGDAGLSCDAAHKALSQSKSCHACFSCELCERGLADSLLPQELFQEGASGRIEGAAAVGGLTAGSPLRRLAVVVAGAIAAGSASTILLLTIKLSRRWWAQPALDAGSRNMGYTDAFAMEESMACSD